MGRITRGRNRLANMSLKRCFALISFAGMAVALVLSLLSILLLEGFRNLFVGYGGGYSLLPDPLSRSFTHLGVTLLDLVVPVGICLGTMMVCARKFYSLKLARPFRLLEQAADKIAANELDFALAYPYRDEMGQLCQAFETMRGALYENHKRMWRDAEERKLLNAAFAHDLRTPITVLKGYADFLGKYVPQGRVDQEKLLVTLGLLGASAARLEAYVDEMSHIQRLELTEFHPQPVDMRDFLAKVSGSLAALSAQSGVACALAPDQPQGVLRLDEGIALRVLENMAANACRYARSRVTVTCGREGKYLTLSVEDDGDGFTPEALERADQAFYTDRTRTDHQRLGMGLNICKVLCRKHGGALSLANGPEGGGQVIATLEVA